MNASWLLFGVLIGNADLALADHNDYAAWEASRKPCVPGLELLPESPYGLIRYCEGALGTYIAIVQIGPIGAPSNKSGKWTLINRYWMEAPWSDDVTGFHWDPSSQVLNVSTSPIYGAGAYFALALPYRSVKQLLPVNRVVSESSPGPGYWIQNGKPQQIEPTH